MIGEEIHKLATRLWPLNRSLTGDGVRETLSVLKEHLPQLTYHEVPSGTQAFDWKVPKEWRVKQAYITTPCGKRICDFAQNNLHLVGYSTPVHAKMDLAELQAHLHSLPSQPEAIPYTTSFYREHWGFCLSQTERENLKEGEYEVLIDSELFDGALTYGELLLKGESPQEVFVSTYVCHPSMANNELSGPCVATYIAKRLSGLNRRFSYRFVFIPETIGSIVYLSRNLEHLKKHVIAGFNVSCVGDDRAYSFLPSRSGDTLSDEIAQHVLKHIAPDYKAYKWRDRGSDERQYCAPGVDLPIASIMRSKYARYDEYHTSLDDLISVVTPQGLEGGFNALWRAIETLENHRYPKANFLCEPQLGKRGLYPSLSIKKSGANVRLMMDLLSWADGRRSLLQIAEECEVPVWDLYATVESLAEHQLLSLLDAPLENA
jgi:aminopeptidase-like protein